MKTSLCAFPAPLNATLLVVSGFLVETIGINEDKFRIYEELQLTKHSIPVECRRFAPFAIEYSTVRNLLVLIDANTQSSLTVLSSKRRQSSIVHCQHVNTAGVKVVSKPWIQKRRNIRVTVVGKCGD